MKVEKKELKDKYNPTIEALKQEISLYDGADVPYPNPTNLVEEISNYQWTINNLQYKMIQLLEKAKLGNK
jgi:hypothetical protein